MAKEKGQALKAGVYCIIAVHTDSKEKTTVYKSHNKAVSYMDKMEDEGYEVKWFNAVG